MTKHKTKKWWHSKLRHQKTKRKEKNICCTCVCLFVDVAIGAPQEDELKGAVYIYNGRRDGISSTPSQVQTATLKSCMWHRVAFSIR